MNHIFFAMRISEYDRCGKQQEWNEELLLTSVAHLVLGGGTSRILDT